MAMTSTNTYEIDSAWAENDPSAPPTRTVWHGSKSYEIGSATYKVDSACDESGCSAARRMVWYCTLYSLLTVIGGGEFDTEEDAVACGERWLAKAGK